MREIEGKRFSSCTITGPDISPAWTGGLSLSPCSNMRSFQRCFGILEAGIWGKTCPIHPYPTALWTNRFNFTLLSLHIIGAVASHSSLTTLLALLPLTAYCWRKLIWEPPLQSDLLQKNKSFEWVKKDSQAFEEWEHILSNNNKTSTLLSPPLLVQLITQWEGC